MSFTLSAREEARNSTTSRRSTMREEGMLVGSSGEGSPTFSAAKIGTVSQIAQDILSLNAARGFSTRPSVNTTTMSQVNVNAQINQTNFNTQTTSQMNVANLNAQQSQSQFNVAQAQSQFNVAQQLSQANLVSAQQSQNQLRLTQATSNANLKASVALSQATLRNTSQVNTDYSEVEAAILKAIMPFDVQETEVITVNGETGVWANRYELENWKGVIPITQYLINEDSNPEVIRKQTQQQLIYEQEIAVRYLRPPTPPPPGEIHIKEEKNIPTPPAPPMVIRQQPPRPETPAPLVVREAPPQPPAQVGPKVITISGKRLPPPPRKVVIERLAPLPSKPQSVIIERWLPYNEQKRRVIFQKNTVPDPIVQAPRNVIIQWEPPSVTVKKEFRDLGVIRANPVEYVQRYGVSLKTFTELPEFVKEIRPPTGVVLAAEYRAPSVMELEGDVQALNMIDLEREGLSQYRSLLQQFTQRMSTATVTNKAASKAASRTASFATGFNANGPSAAEIINNILTQIFGTVDIDSNNQITVNEAEKLLLVLNSRLGRQYGEDDVNTFFTALDSNNDGFIDFGEFKSALVSHL